MQTIEARAKSYVEGCELQGKEARKAEFDYIAGAKEEHLLLTEWRNGKDMSPEVGRRVLCKTNGGKVVIGFRRADGRWSLVGTGLIGEDSYISWRPIHEYELSIHECELPKYYGDDDGREE
jgi:ribosomal protein L34